MIFHDVALIALKSIHLTVSRLQTQFHRPSHPARNRIPAVRRFEFPAIAGACVPKGRPRTGSEKQHPVASRQCRTPTAATTTKNTPAQTEPFPSTPGRGVFSPLFSRVYPVFLFSFSRVKRPPPDTYSSTHLPLTRDLSLCLSFIRSREKGIRQRHLFLLDGAIPRERAKGPGK